MLNRREARMVGLAALGAMLEFYDFVVYLFVAAALGDAFFPPDVSPWTRQIETFAIFAIGYLVRPVAGIVMAHFGDTVGRKKMFIFLIILMAVPTFLIGHASKGFVLAPMLNNGESAVLFCFVFLFLAAAAGGRPGRRARSGRRVRGCRR